MIDTILNVGKIKQEVQMMVKRLFFFSLWLLIFFLVFLMMLTAGWLKIIIDGSEVSSDLRRFKEGIISKQQIKPEHENLNWDNRLFRVEYHTVKPGETLIDLEDYYGTNWRVIKRVNKIESPFNLKSGTILIVPIRIADS